MHKPIPQTRDKFELLHAQLDEWIRARHMRLMTAQRALGDEKGNLALCLLLPAINLLLLLASRSASSVARSSSLVSSSLSGTS